MPKGILFKITKAGKESYLLATNHLNQNANLLATASKILEDKEPVVFEINSDLDDIKSIQQSFAEVSTEWWMNQMGFYHPLYRVEYIMSNASLVEKMSNLYDKVLEINCKDWKDLPPIGMYINLVNQILTKSDLVPKKRFEQLLHAKAKELHKPVVGLETISAHLSGIYGLSLDYQEQCQYMESILEKYSAEKFIDLIKSNFAELTQVYLDQDLLKVRELCNKPLIDDDAHCKYMKGLFADRDENMASAMQTYLDKGNAFIAIGAGHLHKVLEILTSKDYVIEVVPIAEAKSEEKETPAISHKVTDVAVSDIPHSFFPTSSDTKKVETSPLEVKQTKGPSSS